MEDGKEEVRSRLDIEDVVGQYVQLKRAGRNFKGLSPFSEEKTPSFFVSPDKHIWHDFSSNKGGDVFSFIMEVEGMDFRAALEHLARKAGVDLSQYQSKGNQDFARRKKRLIEANELATQYYQHSLIKNNHAVEYVFGVRKLSKGIAHDFRIGYAPTSGDALTSFLQKKGFSKKELSDAGLVNRFGGDLFRGRMMVPLMDASGQVIGFTARILADEPNAPKYLNTPGTLLYDKSRHVFGLSQAKEAIRADGHTVIVEGNLDVVSSHQAGVRSVVATAGTAMTEHHLRALRRLSENVRLAFDADKAGLSATERALPIARSVGIELSIITLPGEAKDPDELIQKDVTLWQGAIDTAEPAMDWVLRQYATRDDLTTANGKRRFTSAALSIVCTLPDAVEREHYVVKIAEMSHSSPTSVQTKLASLEEGEAKQKLKPVAVQESNEQSADSFSYQDNVLCVGLIDVAARALFATVEPALFAGEQRQRLATFLVQHPDETFETTPEELKYDDTYVKILLLKADARYAAWDDKDRYYETARLLRQVATQHKINRKEQLQTELQKAESNGDNAEARTLLEQINQLNKEITRGKR